MISFILNSIAPKNRFLFNKRGTNKYSIKTKLQTFKIQKQNKLCMCKENRDSSEVWEMDFFSRPVIGTDGKKIWELIVVDEKETFEHIETVPNNLVNSKELKKRIKKLIETKKTKPTIIKFFRNQMFNMISIALSDLDLIIKPSRRTFSLFKTIQQREELVYPTMEGFKSFLKENQTREILKLSPQKMPDTLKGEMYTFASIEKSNALKIQNQLINDMFYNSFPVELISEDKIPGLIIYSNRAKSLSSWLGSIELCNVFYNIETKNIVIECGLNTQYLFGRTSDFQTKEAIIFEKSKNDAKGVHFISVQDFSKQQEIFGFWLLSSQI